MLKTSTYIQSRLERVLFPLKHMLLLNVMDPLQWFYIEPMVRALNRSVVVLCHFDLHEAGVLMPGGAHAVELSSIYADLTEDVKSWMEENFVFADIASIYLNVLQPVGLLVCGHSEKEKKMAELAQCNRLKVAYLAQGCSLENVMPYVDLNFDWVKVGCLLPVSSDDKRNIVGVCIRGHSRDERSRKQFTIVKELCESFPAAQIGVIQSYGGLVENVDDLQLRALPKVRLLPAVSWKNLISRGRVVVSDDKELLSQASISGCRPLLYDWETDTCALWTCSLNGLHLPARGDSSAQMIAQQCNIEFPYGYSGLISNRLHLGCGHNFLEGWFNTDIYDGGDVGYLNAGKTYPFSDETFEYIFSEHLFEHLSVTEGQIMLQECFRILKPGGHLRLTLPDIDFLIRLYLYPEEECHKEYIRWSIENFDKPTARLYEGEDVPAMFVLNNFIREWGHRMVYSKPVLENLLKKIGFKDVLSCQSGESRWPAFKGIEHHGTQIPPAYNLLESMTLEAVK